jgi:hypothetical protein
LDGNKQLSDGEMIYCASCGKGMTVVKDQSTAETFACQPHTITYFCSKECLARAEPPAAQGEADVQVHHSDFVAGVLLGIWLYP